jgi:hypothetical protein
MGRRPGYLVYAVDSFSGVAFSERDMPERLSLVGSCEAVNSDAAQNFFEEELEGRPALILRINTVEQGALKTA